MWMGGLYIYASYPHTRLVCLGFLALLDRFVELFFQRQVLLKCIVSSRLSETDTQRHTVRERFPDTPSDDRRYAYVMEASLGGY